MKLVGGGLTIVIDNEPQFSKDTEADVGRLLDSVRIVTGGTHGCHSPAFDPGPSLKHRDGKCEPCALKALDKEL